MSKLSNLAGLIKSERTLAQQAAAVALYRVQNQVQDPYKNLNYMSAEEIAAERVRRASTESTDTQEPQTPAEPLYVSFGIEPKSTPTKVFESEKKPIVRLGDLLGSLDPGEGIYTAPNAPERDPTYETIPGEDPNDGPTPFEEITGNSPSPEAKPVINERNAILFQQQLHPPKSNTGRGRLPTPKEPAPDKRKIIGPGQK